MRDPKPIERIRKTIFDLNQEEFGKLAGTTQASVSRWETGQQEPSISEMERIRAAAVERGLPWDDRWFFEPVPPEVRVVA
ncbi:MAG TPA: helix-turn-helix domain-containing protein [Xanthobacteraceae bacterium]|nr:helix-turn-helix domain-containing protein [Xanthobacteraceae bacterium]